MPFKEPSQPNDEQWRRESDADLIKRGADYELKNVPLELADELIKEQKDKLYPDLASYIRLNKSIACPKEEFGSKAFDILTDPVFRGMIVQDGDNFYYLDSNGDISAFAIGVEDLKTIGSLSNEAGQSMLYQELERLGFKTSKQEKAEESLHAIRNMIIGKTTEYRKRKIEEEEKKNHKEFDF